MSRPLLLALVPALLLFAACKTLPSAASEPPPENTDLPAETPSEIVNAAELLPETDTEEYLPQFVARAEESVEPLEMPVDGDLIEPVYDMSRPETDDLAQMDPSDPETAVSEIVLDEAAIKPEQEEPAPDEAVSEEADVAETTPDEPLSEEVAETLVEETAPLEEVPPPPPAAALRRTESASAPARTAPPAVPTEPLPVLTARNPPVETEMPAKPVARRTLNVRTGQSFDIPFPETGWIYTGEEDSKNGVNYDSRRVENGTQTFTFRAEKEGDYTLTFYRQDFLRDYYTNESVNVIVRNDTPAESSAGMPTVAVAGDTPPAESAGMDMTAATETAAEAAGGDDYLRQAREAAAAQKYADAVALLDKFREQRPGMNDEAWWLYGQSFEAASPVRDIKSALDAYSYLTREYPQSQYYREAQNRIAFLNKFYFNIR